MIKISGLNKHYKAQNGDTTCALNDINLTIDDGEFVAIIGPSGCGKTTLLKILAGLEGDVQGTAMLNGQKITTPSSDIGMVFQEPTLLPWRTILDNILLPIELKHLDRESYRDKALSLMEMTRLKGFETKYPCELSGGMRQRAGICRALIRDPKVLLMDEPFAALDAMNREFLNEELQKIWLASKKTILFVTHSIDEAIFLADRIVIMSPRPGRITRIVPIDIPRIRKRNDLTQSSLNEIYHYVREHFIPYVE